LGAELIVRVLGDLSAYPEVPQPVEGVTYAHKIDKAEARLDFTKGSRQVHRQIRAFNPSPGAFFELGDERFKVLEANILTDGPPSYAVSFATVPGEVLDDQFAIGCGDGAIRPTVIQRAGRGPMDTLELLRGFPIPSGTLIT
jgi:methionyl-tRNA formyltransferase